MKAGIKEIIEDVLEASISSSKVVSLLLVSVKTLAGETKKLAESMLALKERIELHEKAIASLCELCKNDIDAVDKQQVFAYAKQTKDTSKPN